MVINLSDFAVEIKNLKFSYEKNVTLSIDSLQIPKGEFLSVIGPNGGGKSTFIKLLLGLLKPDSGDVTIMGKTPSQLKGEAGYVPQYTKGAQGFPITVFQAVMGAREKVLGKHPDNAKRVNELLSTFDILELSDRRLDDLSGGQRQRVFTARALAIDPKILLLDEPASNIDTSGQKKLYDVLKSYGRSITIIIVSHDISIIPKYSTSVACVNKCVHLHNEPTLPPELLQKTYGDLSEHCPVELVAHGVPHRVLAPHDKKGGCCHD